MENILERLEETQVQFIKVVLGMYISNNIIDSRTSEETDEYIAGMLAGDDFYYLVSYIVDEVIKEPEWKIFLENNNLSEDQFTKEEWEEIFTEILKTIDYNWIYSSPDTRNNDILEFVDLFNVELKRQAEIRAEEEKKRKEEEKKRVEEEETKKKAEEEARKEQEDKDPEAESQDEEEKQE